MATLRQFYRAYSLKAMRLKLTALFGLNVTDALLTLFLLQTGNFYEVNFLLSGVTQEPALFLAYKILLPGFLLGFLGFRLGFASEKQLRTGNVLVSFALSLYGLINLLHLLWLCLHFSGF